MDVKVVFLNGVIEQEVYIKYRQGFEVKDRVTHVRKLKMSLYGLKQALRACYGRIDSFLTSLGFTKSKFDPNLYMNIMDDNPAILILYADYLFLTGNEKQITDCKKKLAEEIKMKNIGLM